ncbi:MAG: ATP phosphoribosyltransferase regulatory subunit [Halieaceae bacterium]|nr:ATP phosphoribosyltransferase regulatory subunit [Halieaceae bacterium]
MTSTDRWQLPDGIEEVLPGQAAHVEQLRRDLLDLFCSWGYELVIPPLVEFTESLLVGLGADLDLLTFKMTDQLSGRSLGVRADITPQVARIDAHSLGSDAVTRLCYAGSTLHTRPKTPMASRSPIQLGAELYGDGSLAADAEVIGLMLATLGAAGVCKADKTLTLDLGHVGVYEAVLKAAELDDATEEQVFDALQRKSKPDLEEILERVSPNSAEMILALLELHGDDTVLARAREAFADVAPAAVTAIGALEQIAAIIRNQHNDIGIYFDLAELRGYHYHTGIVFAAYVDGHGQALANGGRYDNVGEVFGRARPATGFATDLKAVVRLLTQDEQAQPGAISAPAVDDAELIRAVAALRAQGEVVINMLGSEADPRCDRRLVAENTQWVVKPIND